MLELINMYINISWILDRLGTKCIMNMSILIKLFILVSVFVRKHFEFLLEQRQPKLLPNEPISLCLAQFLERLRPSLGCKLGIH